MGILLTICAWFLGYIAGVSARLCFLVLAFGFPFLSDLQKQDALLGNGAARNYKFRLLRWLTIIGLITWAMFFWLSAYWLPFGIGLGLAILATVLRYKRNPADLLRYIQPLPEHLDQEKLETIYPEAFGSHQNEHDSESDAEYAASKVLDHEVWDEEMDSDDWTEDAHPEAIPNEREEIPPLLDGENEDGRRSAKFAAIFILGGLIVGIIAMGPYLLEEHRRFEPWKILLIYFSDLVAIFWFVQYCFSVFVRGNDPRDPETVRRWMLPTFLIMLVSWSVDAGMTFYLRTLEEKSFNSAVQITGRADVARIRDGTKFRVYHLTVSFETEDGRTFSQDTSLRASHEKGFKPYVPESVSAALSGGKSTFPVPLKHNPKWPQQFWFAFLPWEETDTGFISLSKLFLLAQALGIMAFGALLFPGPIPSWAALDRVLPLICQAVVLYIFGLIFLSASFL